MNHHVPLVWLIVESNHFCYVILGNYTIHTQYRLHWWGQSEAFSNPTIPSWLFTAPFSLELTLFIGLSLPIFFFGLFIILVGWMVHVHYIKFPFHIVLGSPIPILVISGTHILWFLDSPIFNMVKSLNITLVGVPYFSVGAGMGSMTNFYLNCCKDRSFFFIESRQTSC